jgi:predicted transcriptional regulator
MAMTLRLDPDTHAALKARAEVEGRSMQEVVGAAIVEYVDRHARTEALGRILDEEVPRYADALRRLGE